MLSLHLGTIIGQRFTEFTFNILKDAILDDKQGQKITNNSPTQIKSSPGRIFGVYSNTNQKFSRQKFVPTGHMKYLVKDKFN